jgi:VanZ family protein
VNRGHILAACIAICAGYFIVGLWPFNFHPRNSVTWSPDGRGLDFGPLSAVYGESAPNLANGAGAVSIELYLQPHSESVGDIASILSLYDGKLPENLLIAQWKSGLLLRVPVYNAQGERKYRELGVAAGLRPGVRRIIGITSGPGGTVFYVDGALAKAYTSLTLHPDALRGRLILGNRAAGNYSWRGRLLGLAVFRRSLSPAQVSSHYRLWVENAMPRLSLEPGLAALWLFDESSGSTIQDHSGSHSPLLIPKFYHVLSRTIFLAPWKDSLHFNDIAINVLGFIPFGFCYFLYRMQSQPGRPFRNAILTIILSGIISAAIELIQAYLPTRSSSVTDLLCNTGGSLPGVVLAAVFKKLSVNRKALCQMAIEEGADERQKGVGKSK